MKYVGVKLSELNEGSLQERFEYELTKVAENVMDANTDPEKKRKINITMTIMADEQRDQLFIDSEVKSTLVPRKNVSAKVLIDTDGEHTYANELKSNQRGQMFFDDDGGLHDDQGTPVEDIEKTEVEKQEPQKSNNVRSFRKEG